MKATLYNPQQAPIALQAMYRDHIKHLLLQGYPVEVSFEHDLRTVKQNAQQWPYLQAFAKQVPCDVNGQMVLVTDEDWKDILTSAYRNETPRVARGFDGAPPVMLGQRTSKFTRTQWPEWMEFVRFAAAQRRLRVAAPKSLEEVEA
jgi:hypothetical protein